MPDLLRDSINFITLLVMLAGLFGLVIPVLPGLIIIWFAALGFGIVSGFGSLGGWMFAGITLLAVVGSLLDNVLVGVGAKRGGASWLAIGIGVVAGILGTLLLPPVGGLIAFPIVVYLYERYRLGEHEKAVKSLKGMAYGWGLAFIFRFLMGLVMIFLWALWAWQG